MLINEDKLFLVSFEQVEPDWDSVEYGYFAEYPSVKWKLLNLAILKKENPAKLRSEAEKLSMIFP